MSGRFERKADRVANTLLIFVESICRLIEKHPNSGYSAITKLF